MHDSTSAALASLAATLQPGSCGTALANAVDKVLLDSFAVTLAGVATPEIQALHNVWPFSSGESTVWGTDLKTDPATAALLNGTSLCCLELDEGNKFARGHPGAHVLPAAFAEAERLGSSATQLRCAFLAGYEVAARMGRGFQPHGGLHPHGTWGTIGAAVAVAKLNGARYEELVGAIDAAAGLSLAPPFSAATSGTFVRNTWAGTAGAHGMSAARLALAGLAPAHSTDMAVFDGLLGSLNVEEVVRDLGQRWEIESSYIKRHSACNYTHAAADAALEIYSMPGFAAGLVTGVTVETHALALPLDEPNPTSRLAAMFSIPHVVAIALIDGACSPRSFAPESLDRPEVVRLRHAVSIDLDAEIDAARPGQRGARVTVRLLDGTTLVTQVPNAIGDADYHPLDRAAVHEKASALIGPQGASAIARALDHDDLPAIAAALQHPKDATL